MVGVVDDEDFDGAFAGFELEAKLLLHGGKEGRERGVLAVGKCIVGLPAEVDVEVAGDAGLIDDNTASIAGELLRDDRQGDALCVEVVAPVVDESAVEFIGESFAPLLATTSA